MAKKPRLDDLIELQHQAHTLGLASHHLVNSSFHGIYASVFRGQGLNFEEVRQYYEGDDIRNMDWKVTARTNQPHLKVYREERERSVVLCVDKGPHMHFGTRGTFKFIQAARAAALLGWAANSLNDRVGGVLFGDAETGPQYYRPTKGRRALWQTLKGLSEPANDTQSGVDCLDQVLRRADRGAGTGALIFVIADFNRNVDNLYKGLGQLSQRHSVVLIPVDDPAEKNLPSMGRTLFRAPDGHMIEVDTDNEQGRKAYSKNWEDRRQSLIRMANKLRIAVIPVQTDKEVHRALMEGLEMRARSRSYL
ncbi:MAG: DUF58 domain-containing protein [Thiohalocapsa sp.]